MAGLRSDLFQRAETTMQVMRCIAASGPPATEKYDCRYRATLSKSKLAQASNDTGSTMRCRTARHRTR
jgi:hypothetical protein